MVLKILKVLFHYGIVELDSKNLSFNLPFTNYENLGNQSLNKHLLRTYYVPGTRDTKNQKWNGLFPQAAYILLGEKLYKYTVVYKIGSRWFLDDISKMES